jgi:hypothetical protein
MVFVTGAIGIVIILWDVRRQARTLAPSLDFSQKMRRAFFIGCAAVAIAIWTITWPLYFPAPAIVVEGPTTPKPQEPPKPQPPPPWVSADEIATQQQLGRILLPYSPRELLEMWHNGRNVGAYFGKWIKIDYQFQELTLETVEKKQLYLIKMEAFYGYVYAYFEPKKWEARLMEMRVRTDQVKAICQFERIDEVEQIKRWPKLSVIVSDHCDFL